MTRLHKTSILLLKYMPVLVAVIMMVHVCTLLLGFDGLFSIHLIGLPLIPYLVSLF